LDRQLKKLLADNRPAIVGKWRESVIALFPSEASHFLSSQKNPFSNPIGHAITTGTETLFEALLDEDTAPEAFDQILDGVIRINAVQEFPASRAASFPLLLKGAIHEVLKRREGGEIPCPSALLEFESRIDAVALRAFDAYVKCREKIHELRVKQVKSNARLFAMANGMAAAAGAESPEEADVAIKTPDQESHRESHQASHHTRNRFGGNGT